MPSVGRPSAMHDWKVDIRGSDAAIAVLSRLHPDFVFGKDGEGPWLRSPQLNSLPRAEHVASRVRTVLFNAALFMNAVGNIDGAIQPYRVTCQHSGCPDFWFVGLRYHLSVRSEARAAVFDDLVDAYGPELIELANANKVVGEVLNGLGLEQPEWPGIYIALEAISRSLRHDHRIAGSEWDVLETIGWIPAGLAGPLKQTSNFYRHAPGGKATLPTHAPSIHDAREHLRTVLTSWFAWQLGD